MRVLGEEKRLLATPKWGRGLSAQGPCGCPAWEGKRQMERATKLFNTPAVMPVQYYFFLLWPKDSIEARQETQETNNTT